MNGCEPIVEETSDAEINRLLDDIIDEVEFLADDGPVRILEVEEEEDESDNKLTGPSGSVGYNNTSTDINDNNNMESAPNLGLAHRIDHSNNINLQDSDSESREYIIEKILDKTIDSKGCAKYLVKWQGYSSKDNTWEPIEYLVGCDKAMQAYEISQAHKLADRINKRQSVMQNNEYSNGHTAKRAKFRNYEVNDIMGATLLKGELYFLVSITDSTRKTFIRASLANKMLPGKVIDFYVKHIQWDTKAGCTAK